MGKMLDTPFVNKRFGFREAALILALSRFIEPSFFMFCECPNGFIMTLKRNENLTCGMRSLSNRTFHNF